MTVRGCALRTDRLDAIFHVDGPRFFEPQLSLQFFALFERLPQIHEHDVVAVGSEFDLLARLDLSPPGTGRICMTLPSIFIS